MAELVVYIDLEASLAALAANEHDHDGMLKFREDLDRYAAVIEATEPDVIVETGTRTGASARWFWGQGLDVITIDNNPGIREGDGTGITFVEGSSTDPMVVEVVRDLVAGRRCMVSLDSEHSAGNVALEIVYYGSMVTSGCYLVVEDAILGYADESLLLRNALAGLAGSPLDAIAEQLDGNQGWLRDIGIERMHPVSHNPAGWWQRV